MFGRSAVRSCTINSSVALTSTFVIFQGHKLGKAPSNRPRDVLGRTAERASSL